MLKKILVPLDGSNLAEDILLVVEQILTGSDAKVILLHVKPEEADETSAEAVAAMRSHLSEKVGELETRGVDADFEMRTGDPAEQILEAIKSLSPSLVAMSTHGRSGINRLLRGSVAERVLRQSTAPVLLANPESLEELKSEEPHAFSKILVPLDGSDRSARILPLVTDLARLYESEVLLLFVAPVPLDFASDTDLPPYHLVSNDGEGQEVLEPYAEQLAGSGVEVSTLSVTGYPAGEILSIDESEDADLIAMTTHGRSGLSRWLLGSVAENVIRHCHSPLLLMRTTDAD